MGFVITPVAWAMEYIREPEEFAYGSKTREFVMLVAEAFPGCKFATAGSHIEVFYPEDAYCMGRIGVGDFGVRVFTGEKYAVWSRTIDNEHYPYLKQTEDLKKAVKLAKQYLRRLSAAETISVQASDAARTIYNDRKAPSESFYRVMNGLTRFNTSKGEPRIITELRALQNAGHQFVTVDFAKEVAEALNLYDETRCKKEEYDGFGVWVHEVDGQTVIDVCHIPKMHYAYQVAPARNHIRYTTESLPEGIAAKVAVLSMLEIGGSVAGVGTRRDNNMYYFEATT
jgi:hypothetical protein